MRYQIIKIQNGEWRLEWEDGSFSTHSTQYGAEKMVLQIQNRVTPQSPSVEEDWVKVQGGGYINVNAPQWKKKIKTTPAEESREVNGWAEKTRQILRNELIDERLIDHLMGFLTEQFTLARREVLEFISKKEGWEQSKDHYARLLGINLTTEE